eukprot:m51a1_g6234 hypothetical protein (483) ;mRNA; f:317335-319564
MQLDEFVAELRRLPRRAAVDAGALAQGAYAQLSCDYPAADADGLRALRDALARGARAAYPPTRLLVENALRGAAERGSPGAPVLSQLCALLLRSACAALVSAEGSADRSLFSEYRTDAEDDAADAVAQGSAAAAPVVDDVEVGDDDFLPTDVPCAPEAPAQPAAPAEVPSERLADAVCRLATYSALCDDRVWADADMDPCVSARPVLDAADSAPRACVAALAFLLRDRAAECTRDAPRLLAAVAGALAAHSPELVSAVLAAVPECAAGHLAFVAERLQRASAAGELVALAHVVSACPGGGEALAASGALDAALVAGERDAAVRAGAVAACTRSEELFRRARATLSGAPPLLEPPEAFAWCAMSAACAEGEEESARSDRSAAELLRGAAAGGECRPTLEPMLAHARVLRASWKGYAFGSEVRAALQELDKSLRGAVPAAREDVYDEDADPEGTDPAAKRAARGRRLRAMVVALLECGAKSKSD